MSITYHKVWIVALLLLLVSLVIGIILLTINCTAHRPQEIIITATEQLDASVSIYIGGAVASPGYYPVTSSETLADIIGTAGPLEQADLSGISIHIPENNAHHPPQRIDINRADAWLLEALPGIGAGKAQSIIDYRLKHGRFNSVKELLTIEGIGPSTLEEIEDFITVED